MNGGLFTKPRSFFVENKMNNSKCLCENEDKQRIRALEEEVYVLKQMMLDMKTQLEAHGLIHL